MTRIPTPALILGTAGLIPFILGAAGMLSPGLADWTRASVSQDFSYLVALGQYAIVILAFMSGAIWGFAARATDPRDATLGYAMSVIAALWAFGIVWIPLRPSVLGIAAGLVALLAVDLWAVRRGLAPAWWLRLRLMLTAVAATCLLIGALA